MADALAAQEDLLEEGFRQCLHLLLDKLDARGVKVLEQRSSAELFEVGQRAAQLALALFVEDSRLGPMLETGEVCEQLGVTRQAVAKAVDAGRLIALPAGRTRRFPAWQFAFGAETQIRHEVAEIVTAFQEGYPEVRPNHIASWAMTSQPELKDMTPSAWLEEAGPREPLLDAARRAGWALAQ
jgi:excisionase family DNA binding protein